MPGKGGIQPAFEGGVHVDLVVVEVEDVAGLACEVFDDVGEDLDIGLHHVELVTEIGPGEERLYVGVLTLAVPVERVRVGKDADLEIVRQVGDELLRAVEQALWPIGEATDHLGATEGQSKFFDDAFTEFFRRAAPSLEVTNRRATKPTSPELINRKRIIAENLCERAQLDEHATHVEHNGAVGAVPVCHPMHGSGTSRRQAGRMPLRPSRRIRAITVGLILLISACSSDDAAAPPLAAEAVTLAALPDGGFLWADISGSVNDQEGNEVGSVDAVTDGQRGLLGLAVDSAGRIFVSYTDVTFDLVVSELVDGSERQVWRGPTTVQGGNGGRLVLQDGELIIGIGLLNDRAGQADPTSIVGKLIAIDPNGTPESQSPRILSGPWNNPFAFDARPDGSIWVADNEPRDGDERLARGDLGIGPEVALVLPADSAPSGLAATSNALFVCSYNSLQLDRYEFTESTPVFAETIADDCVFDVEILANGDLIYSTGTSIVRLTP